MFGQTHARLFALAEFPSFVFRQDVRACAWLYFDSICSFDGWSFLTALTTSRGDDAVHVAALRLEPAEVLTLRTTATADDYAAICDNEFVGADVVRWWGDSGEWGIHGSRSVEVAVACQLSSTDWPLIPNCELLSIDAALRLARIDADEKARILESYDRASWDPAAPEAEVLPELTRVCAQVASEQVDPIIAVRRLVDLLDRAPKGVRRIGATDRLHEAWSRSGYLLFGNARDSFGPLLLEQNDRNHERHSAEERALVRDACLEITQAVARFRSNP